MSKIDPYHLKGRWESWKARNMNGIEGLSKTNSRIILDFLIDMEMGRNISPRTKKGARSAIRLHTLKQKVIFIVKYLDKPIPKLTEKEITGFFNGLHSGKILKANGQPYLDVGDYVKDFKSFWSWMLRTRRAKHDTTVFLSRNTPLKPAWVYLEEKQMFDFIAQAPRDIQPLLLLFYDAGFRVTEACSIRVCDFQDNFMKLNIPNEVSKTFGRKITLTFSREPIMQFIKENNLGLDDCIFTYRPQYINHMLKSIAKAFLGDQNSLAREKYSNFTLYDIRHNSACYWANRYKTTKGLMYRLGWMKESQALYYHEFLGHRDEIESPSQNIEMIALSKKIDFLISLINQNLEPRAEGPVYELLKTAKYSGTCTPSRSDALLRANA